MIVLSICILTNLCVYVKIYEIDLKVYETNIYMVINTYIFI